MHPKLLTITPGSELDRAINACVDYELGVGPVPDLETLRMIDPTESGHMVAVGCRIDCRRRGKTDPSMLTHHEYHGWYGIRL